MLLLFCSVPSRIGVVVVIGGVVIGVAVIVVVCMLVSLFVF